MTETAWAIIPARGGSKRLKRKNLLPIEGQPMVAHAVNTVLASNCFARVIVSTDDEEIAQAAREAGGEVPFLRPAKLASDTATSVDVVLHAVEALTVESIPPAIIALIQVTSPLLTAQHLQEALELFSSGDFNSLSAMKAVTQYPEWMFQVDTATSRAIPESSTGIVTGTAAIPRRYIENGAVYLVRSQWLQEKRSLYDFARHACYLMSEADSVDIDTAEDYARAQFEIERRQLACR